jgi:hypothetical protein
MAGIVLKLQNERWNKEFSAPRRFKMKVLWMHRIQQFAKSKGQLEPREISGRMDKMELDIEIEKSTHIR